MEVPGIGYAGGYGWVLIGKKKRQSICRFFLQIMFKDAFLCNLIDFVIFPCADYNNQHIVITADELVDDTQPRTAELDF